MFEFSTAIGVFVLELMPANDASIACATAVAATSAALPKINGSDRRV
jgi:hypothetical protein